MQEITKHDLLNWDNVQPQIVPTFSQVGNFCAVLFQNIFLHFVRQYLLCSAYTLYNYEVLCAFILRFG